MWRFYSGIHGPRCSAFVFVRLLVGMLRWRRVSFRILFFVYLFDGECGISSQWFPGKLSDGLGRNGLSPVLVCGRKNCCVWSRTRQLFATWHLRRLAATRVARSFIDIAAVAGAYCSRVPADSFLYSLGMLWDGLAYFWTRVELRFLHPRDPWELRLSTLVLRSGVVVVRRLSCADAAARRPRRCRSQNLSRQCCLCFKHFVCAMGAQGGDWFFPAFSPPPLLFFFSFFLLFFSLFFFVVRVTRLLIGVWWKLIAW